MKQFGWLVVAVGLAVASSGCGSSEGGVVGSGISAATVSGNIVAVDEGPAGGAIAPLPAVRVSIEEVEGIDDLTSTEGAFELSGAFAGPVTIRFENRGGRLLGRLPLDVPAGSTVLLDDLEIRPGLPNGVRPREIRQRNLFGRVVAVDCATAMVLVDDDISRPFRVQILAQTEIVRRDGTIATCEEIRRNGVVLVEGQVLPPPEGPVIRAMRLTLSPARPPRPGPPANPAGGRG